MFEGTSVQPVFSAVECHDWNAPHCDLSGS